MPADDPITRTEPLVPESSAQKPSKPQASKGGAASSSSGTTKQDHTGTAHGVGDRVSSGDAGADDAPDAAPTTDDAPRQSGRAQRAAKRRAERAAKRKARERKREQRAEARERQQAAQTTGPATPEAPAGDATPVVPSAGENLLTPPVAVPGLFLNRFQIPPFLLPIYQAAGVQYGVRWELLAAINEIETNYGRNLNVSSAGALGWMQFMPATWNMYGVDANGDGKADPYNPVDAIFAAARYLKAAGAEQDVRRAVFAYNHADWYVDSVLLRARLISGLPADLVSSLTGLTQGVFPVAEGEDRASLGDAAAVTDGDAPESTALDTDGDDRADEGPRRSIAIRTAPGTDAVAVQDGTVVGLGESDRLGRFVRLRDVYGNRYTYGHLGSLAARVPAAGADAADEEHPAAEDEPRDPKPTAAATAGRQERGGEPAGAATDAAPGDAAAPADGDARRPAAADGGDRRDGRSGAPADPDALPATPGPAAGGPVATDGGDDRVRANPAAPDPAPAATVPGDLAAGDPSATPTPTPQTEEPAAPRPVHERETGPTRPLREGTRVTGGTVLGTVGAAKDGEDDPKRAAMTFEVRPAGRNAPRVDPKPLLEGWRLLASSSVLGAKNGGAMFAAGQGGASAGQVLLMSKAQLERRVLADDRIDIYERGREQIRQGLVDRRVLATLAYLSASGRRLTISSLRRPGSITTSGNLSEHDSGNAVDIAAVDGKVISPATQGPGSITADVIRQLLALQGTMKPHQIISLMTPSDFGGADNVLALPDHADHIHVGFHVEQTADPVLGEQARSALKPSQWDTLIGRLGKIENPTVPEKASKYAIRRKGAGRGKR
nr:lytic murein transglycosylase [Patulibacter sp. SYSU D01012]